MSYVLPPLRRQILKQIVKIVFLFACLGFALILIIHESVSNPQMVIEKNQQTTNQVINMLESLDFLQEKMTGISPQSKRTYIRQFEKSLQWFQENSKLPEETDLLVKISAIWKKQNLEAQPLKYDDYSALRAHILQYIDHQQESINTTLKKQLSFSHLMAFLACVVFLIGMIISIYFSEKLSRSIVHPIRKITETLQKKQTMQDKLKFPPPQSLEIKILTMELNNLWTRFQHLHSENMENLEAQKCEMEAIFSSMEDAAVVVDSQGKIQYYNSGFVEILGLPEKKQLQDQKWEDLSLTNDAYLQLRILLRKETQDETLFTCPVLEQDRIYRSRKRMVMDHNNEKKAVILLLHDITNKLPPEKVKETIQRLKAEKSNHEKV